LATFNQTTGIYDTPVLLFGCGNALFGDDGFGPAFIEALLSRYQLPDYVRAEDVGTSIRDILFDLLLSPRKPKKLLIVDAADQEGRSPGEIYELPLGQIAVNKVNDFSVHHFPSLNLLQELSEGAGVEVRMLAVQIKHIPTEVEPGLSREVQEAIPKACQWALAQIGA
jgi:coenzyme F420 hydrogenase subunit delta